MVRPSDRQFGIGVRGAESGGLWPGPLGAAGAPGWGLSAGGRSNARSRL